MSIKEKIGQRIMTERKAKGLTRKALAELTGELKVSRINNYERGDRTPGPTEIKLLAEALEVSASYLMCLTDSREGRITKAQGLGALIPILDYKQATNPVSCIQEINANADKKYDFIPVSSSLAENLSKNAFALKVKDDSMSPEFRINDVIIIDPSTRPSPSDFVIALIYENKEIVVRKYKQLSASTEQKEFELIALNEDWANICINSDSSGKIIGSIISLNRTFKTS